MRADGRPFVGCLFAGLMLTEDGPKVIEFNCRFGDPETQAVIPLLDCDLFYLLSSCVQGELSQSAVRVLPNTSAVSVVLASGGYPGSYKSGHEISGLDRARCVPGVRIFHAGTKTKETLDMAEVGRTPSGTNAMKRMFRRHSDMIANASSKVPTVITSGGRVLPLLELDKV